MCGSCRVPIQLRSVILILEAPEIFVTLRAYT